MIESLLLWPVDQKQVQWAAIVVKPREKWREKNHKKKTE
jgi:hypothetical protein